MTPPFAVRRIYIHACVLACVYGVEREVERELYPERVLYTDRIGRLGRLIHFGELSCIPFLYLATTTTAETVFFFLREKSKTSQMSHIEMEDGKESIE